MLENGTKRKDRWQWFESTEYTLSRLLSPESWGEVLKVEAREETYHAQSTQTVRAA
jgi:hypothetical protein